MLGEKAEKLDVELDGLRAAENSCRNALEKLKREEVVWKTKLHTVKKKLLNADNRRRETSMMLTLHQTLEKSSSLTDTVRTVQGILTDDMPVDMKVMVSDCFNAQYTANSRECVVCMSYFSAEDLLLPGKSDFCRHTLNPCGHSVICGICAKHIWETTQKCPLCRTKLTKRPKIFRPGRQQLPPTSNT